MTALTIKVPAWWPMCTSPKKTIGKTEIQFPIVKLEGNRYTEYVNCIAKKERFVTCTIRYINLTSVVLKN